MIATNGISKPDNYAVALAVMVREQLERRGISAIRVIQAMREVPRHLFVPSAWQHDAYSDRPLPIAEGQTISQPYIVAVMIQSLALHHAARVLEVGTGSGYQAAVLSRLAAQVYTVEYFPALAAQARAVLTRLGYNNVQVVVGDGSVGLPMYAPYEGIIVAAAAPQLPRPLLEQLCDGGRLVIPVGDSRNQELLIVTREGATYRSERRIACRFVPLLGQEGWATPC